MPSAEERAARDPAARQHVDQDQEVGPLLAVLQDLLEQVHVDAGEGDVHPHPVDHQEHEGDPEPRPDVGDAEEVGEAPDHSLSFGLLAVRRLAAAVAGRLRRRARPRASRRPSAFLAFGSRGLLRLAGLDGLGLERLDLDARASSRRPRGAGPWPRCGTSRSPRGPRRVPPAFSTFVRAPALTAFALMVSAFLSSPSPRSFHRVAFFGTRRAPRRVSRSTVAPAGKADSSA